MIELLGSYNKNCKIFLDDMEESCYPLIQSILDCKVSENVPVRIMSDCHAGKDIVIGFTMPLTDMVNPNHIGVDIGCAIVSAKVKGVEKFVEKYGSLESALEHIDTKIRKVVPMGTNYQAKTMAKLDYKEINRRMNSFYQKWLTRFDNYGCPVINEKYIDRKSVVEGKSARPGVDLGGRRSIKKKMNVELAYIR